ncbi:hypothetical protein CGRA01v4_09707 [Colletotrichum graminicola]|nr:hypothetical protein CGRA01v4_09707 [Colletotrichum graminicola]
MPSLASLDTGEDGVYLSTIDGMLDFISCATLGKANLNLGQDPWHNSGLSGS